MYIQCTCVHALYIPKQSKLILVLTSCTDRFLAGNSTPTIPHKYSQHKRSGFLGGTCDTAAADGRRGSNVYELNPWL